jgi:transcription elongation factor Elf1
MKISIKCPFCNTADTKQLKLAEPEVAKCKYCKKEYEVTIYIEIEYKKIRS